MCRGSLIDGNGIRFSLVNLSEHAPGLPFHESRFQYRNVTVPSLPTSYRCVMVPYRYTNYPGVQIRQPTPQNLATASPAHCALGQPLSAAAHKAHLSHGSMFHAHSMRVCLAASHLCMRLSARSAQSRCSSIMQEIMMGGYRAQAAAQDPRPRGDSRAGPRVTYSNQ